MAHTPGTWYFEKIDPDAELTAIGGPVAIVGGNELREKVGFTVGTTQDWGHHGVEQTLANARLIAAAPDMLEALKQARTAMQSFYNDDSWWKLMDEFALVEAAIAKAEGRS